jgi:hypothetical protein
LPDETLSPILITTKNKSSMSKLSIGSMIINSLMNLVKPKMKHSYQQWCMQMLFIFRLLQVHSKSQKEACALVSWQKIIKVITTVSGWEILQWWWAEPGSLSFFSQIYNMLFSFFPVSFVDMINHKFLPNSDLVSITVKYLSNHYFSEEKKSLLIFLNVYQMPLRWHTLW